MLKREPLPVRDNYARADVFTRCFNLFRRCDYRLFIAVMISTFMMQPVFAATMTGRVTDSQGNALSGVDVQLLGTRQRVATNAIGRFRLSGVAAKGARVKLSKTGFKSRVQRVSPGSRLHRFQLAQEQGSPARLGKITVVSTGAAVPGAPLLQPADVDVVQGAEKALNQTSTLGETLSRLMGVSNISAGGSAGKPVIDGLSGERIKILYNGVGVEHQEFGTRHTPTLDPFLAQKIEVVRGASSVLYGSDALGGAINVISPAIPYGKKLNGSTDFSFYSNNEQYNGGIKLGGGTENFGFNGAFIRRSAGDEHTPNEPTYFPPPPTDPSKRNAPAYTGKLKYTDFDELNGGFGAGMRGAFGDITARYTHWSDDHNFLLPPPAGKKPPSAGAEGVGQHLADQELQLQGHLNGTGGLTWIPTVSWQNNLRQSNMEGNPRSVPFDHTLDVEFNQYTARLEARHGPVLGLVDGGTLGAEYVFKDQNSRGNVQLTPGGTVRDAAAFAFEERQVGPLFLQAGVRFDHRDVIAQASKTRDTNINFSGDSGDTYNVLSGSLGGVWRFTQHLALAANVGRGFRAPSLFDLHVNGVHGGVAAVQIGDPNLNPEKSLDTSLSLRWIAPTLKIKATAYRNKVNDYIYPRDSGTTAVSSGLPIFRITQGDAVLYGGDLSIDKQVTSSLDLWAIGSIVRGHLTNGGDALPLLPADNLRLGVRYTAPNWGLLHNPYVSLDWRFDSSKDAAPGEPFSQFDQAPFGTASTGGYGVADAGLGCQLPVLGRNVSLNLEIKNMFNRSYRNFLDTYKGYALSPGRDIRLIVSVPFGI